MTRDMGTAQVRSARRVRRRVRRGVASVLAMLFLVIFASLAAAMAVVAQGNLRTADSALKVTRAQSAAESGLIFAAWRLQREGARFVIKPGDVTTAFSRDLWLGDFSSTDVEVLPPVGYPSTGVEIGLADAIFDAHLADVGSFNRAGTQDASLPSLATDGLLVTKPIRLEATSDRLYFQLTYELVPNEPRVRVTSVGVDRDIERTISLEFRLDKKIEYAIISPSRIMIGKNVFIEGPIGTRYGVIDSTPDTMVPNPVEITNRNGHPLVMRSDFRFLPGEKGAQLSERIGSVPRDPSQGPMPGDNTLAGSIFLNDVDDDGRLRVAHPYERAGAERLGGDRNADQYVDDFDLFLDVYDTNDDGRVTWAPNDSGTEFGGVDDQLARLVDRAKPDRNEDGLEGTAEDILLGYNDGSLDARDRYAKVRGRLAFASESDDWINLSGVRYWRDVVEGPVRNPPEFQPATFGLTSRELRAVRTADFAEQAGWFDGAATSTSLGSPDVTQGPWEGVPFGASAPYDYYRRPIYRNRTYTNIRIPKGTNALFENCTFVGVTYIETNPTNQHPFWNFVAAIKQQDNGNGNFDYVPRFLTGLTATLEGGTSSGTNVTDTRVHSNSIRFHNCTFLGSIAGATPAEYTHWRNKVQITGATRFFSDPADPDISLEIDGSTLRSSLETLGPTALERLQRSSIMLPGWSVDVGNFNNETSSDPLLTPKVKLRGTIIAGLMDIRGTVDVLGTLLMTYRPIPNQGALYFDGEPENFNTTLGYFAPADGDGEGPYGSDQLQGFGEIRLRYDPDAKLPDGIPWPLTVRPEKNTYREGALRP